MDLIQTHCNMAATVTLASPSLVSQNHFLLGVGVACDLVWEVSEVEEFAGFSAVPFARIAVLRTSSPGLPPSSLTFVPLNSISPILLFPGPRSPTFYSVVTSLAL